MESGSLRIGVGMRGSDVLPVSWKTPQIQIGSTSKQYVACRAYLKRLTPVDRPDGYLYVSNGFPFQNVGFHRSSVVVDLNRSSVVVDAADHETPFVQSPSDPRLILSSVCFFS